MTSATLGLYVALAFVAVFYAVAAAAALRNSRAASAGPILPTAGGLATGFVTNFFDTLGIGSFAPTTSIFRFFRMVPDERIPGTLNVGHTPAVILQAYIFTRIVPVEGTTLVLMIGAASLGAWVGAGVVSAWPRRAIQVGMGLCLACAAGLMAAAQLGAMPAGGTAIGVHGPSLLVAVGGNFVLGALMTLGIGLYAPCMVLISLLGMNVKAAFPIMMGSCAFLMPVASARFARTGAFDLRASLGLALGGLPAVAIAAWLVKELPLDVLRWLVVGVVLWTAASLLWTAQRERIRAAAAEG